RLPRSSSATSTAAAANVRISVAAVSPFSLLRHPSTTLAPARASSRAATSPMPLFAPVTMTLRPAWLGICSASHLLLMAGSSLSSSRRPAVGGERQYGDFLQSPRGRHTTLAVSTLPADHSFCASLR